MCGIAGIAGLGPVNLGALAEMTARLAHRGPDGEGLWISEDGRIGFGHRRLAVIDPSERGAQPMADETGRFVVTFNGEIYNYVELAKRLEAAGVGLRSQCDTEVLLEAYKLWGDDCLQDLNGMFAFAIADLEKGVLFAARDRFGEKPFLFARLQNGFAFASELKSLLFLEGVGADIDELRLLRFLHQPRQGLDDGRETVFSGIEQLRPGECLRLDLRTLEARITTYWDIGPDAEAAGLTPAEAAHRFRELLTDSVRIRMRSDVPVGSCLSGGLDSSAVVCLNREILGAGAEYHVFTGRFPDSASDEGDFAAEVVSATAVTAHEVAPRADGMLSEISDFMWFNELPVGSTSQYAQWCVFRLAAEAGVTVLLDGQGADELLGGYEQYFVPYLDAVATLDGPEEALRQRALIEERYPLAFAGAGGGWTSKLPDRWRWRLADFSGVGSDFLFGISSDAAAAVGAANRRDLDGRFHALSAALKDDSLSAHLPTLLRYGDRNSMAHSREVRLPFCDHRLAEFALSLPPGHLMGSAETKHLLRAALGGVLPGSIAMRWNKQGFLPPQADWLSGALGPLLADTIASDTFRRRGYWNVAWWKKALDRFRSGETALAWVLWRPLIAEAWYRHFVSRIAADGRVAPFAAAPAENVG